MLPSRDYSFMSDRTVDANVQSGPTPGIWTVTFRTEALPGTLAGLAGTLTAARLDIISAIVSVSSSGMVTDAFDVAPLGGDSLDASDAERLALSAADVLTGRRNVRRDLEDLRARYPGAADVVPAVEIATDSDLTTGLKIVCADRPGLLYDIAALLSEHGLRTRSLSVLTFNKRAHDTFRVVDSDGRPPKDPRLLETVCGRLRDVCS